MCVRESGWFWVAANVLVDVCLLNSALLNFAGAGGNKYVVACICWLVVWLFDCLLFVLLCFVCRCLRC